jgi:hypothetical protein
MKAACDSNSENGGHGADPDGALGLFGCSHGCTVPTHRLAIEVSGGKPPEHGPLEPKAPLPRVVDFLRRLRGRLLEHGLLGLEGEPLGTAPHPPRTRTPLADPPGTKGHRAR